MKVSACAVSMHSLGLMKNENQWGIQLIHIYISYTVYRYVKNGR